MFLTVCSWGKFQPRGPQSPTRPSNRSGATCLISLPDCSFYRCNSLRHNTGFSLLKQCGLLTSLCLFLFWLFVFVCVRTGLITVLQQSSGYLLFILLNLSSLVCLRILLANTPSPSTTSALNLRSVCSRGVKTVMYCNILLFLSYALALSGV